MTDGEDPPLPVVALADIVRLREPYQPLRGQDRQAGPFGFGIVAELLTALPCGRVRNASLYLYDPARRELFLGPNGIPEFVDCHGSEFELYKRAEDQGYTPLVPHQPVPTPPRERKVSDGA
jgi:hypothetical protein